MTLRLINSLLMILAGATMTAASCCGCGGCCGGCCQPCSNCFPCTNPPLLIKLPPTPPKLCCVPCCCGCCRPCCCGCGCCGCGGRKRRSTMEKNCMKSMKKQTTLCTNATRNCKRCANLPKLEQKLPKISVSNNKTEKKPKSRARRQVEMLGQMFGKSMGILPSQRFFSFNSNPARNGCDCSC